MIELAVAERPAGKTIVAGTGTNDTRQAVFLTERATALGVDAVLSVTPYYNKPTPDGLVQHYRAIASAVPTIRHCPTPQAMPRQAANQVHAALVSPRTRK